MKKLLLSALAAAACATAGAADYTIDFKNAADFEGTFNEEKPKTDTSNGEAPNYKPINSLGCDGFTFTAAKGEGTSDPAYYMTPSFNTATLPTLRMYKNNTLTITAPAGVKMGQIKFVGTSGTKDASCTATSGSVYDVTTTAQTWSTDTPVESVTITYGANFRISSMTVSTEGAAAPEPVEFSKTLTLSTGKYVFAIEQDGTMMVASPEAAGATYGRMSLSKADINDNVISTVEDNAFDITITDGKAMIKDYAGRIYGMDASHLTSFQFYTEPTEGCYWDFAFEGETVKFTNALNTSCVICNSMGTSSWYTNVAPAADPAQFNLPILFAEGGAAGIETVVEEAAVNAPVEYYNLQGVRVAEPQNGIFIRRQGNKVTKVAL